MKKLLVVMLAVVMVFGLATMAYADDLYTDIDEQPTAARDAIHKISALGVVEGYPDKTFKPEGSITRAEFAKIACVMGGISNADFMKSSPTPFKDVATDIWYTGWINVAASSGYVIGYPDGTFKPNATITQAEVITVLVRIAGFDDNLGGTWPTNYIVKANQLELNKNVNVSSNAPATRAQVAIMANNLLGVEIHVYSKDISQFVIVKAGYDVMLANFKAKTADITFIDHPLKDDAVDAWQYDDGTFKVEYISSIDSTTGAISTDYFEVAENCYFAKNVSLATIAGQKAKLILNKDDEIVYLDPTSTFVITSDITKDGANIKVNGTSQKTSGFDASTITEKVYSKVFYNKDGNIYSVVDLTLMDGAKNVPDNTLVLSEYNSSSQKLTRFKNQGSDVTLKDKDYIVFKDGVEVDPEDLEKFDTLFVFNANCGMDFVVCAVTPQTRTVSTYYTGTGGKLEIAFSGISGRQLVVTDGAVSGRTQYSANDGNFNETTPKAVDDYIKGNEGTFAWDRKGNLKYIIVGAVTEATTTVTGVVKSYVTIWDSYTPSLRVGYSSVTIYALDGSSATYSFKDGEDYYDEYGDLMIGDAVQFKVDTNNMITAPDGTFIMAPAATKPVGNEYTVTNGSVAIDGTTYALGSAVILNINWKTPGNRNSGIDSVNVVERSKLGSSFETGEIQYMTTSSTSTTLKYLVLEDFGSSSGSKYAVVSSAGEASRYVYFYGNSARQDAGTAGIGPWYGTEDWLVKYRLDAGKVVWEANVLDLDSPGTDVGIITDITEGSKEGTFIWDDKGTDKNVRFDEDTQILIFNKDLEWVELEDQFLSDFEEDGKAYVVLDGSYAKLIVIITG